MMQDIFSRRLIELMEEQNMTQTELAKRIGTTNVTISRYVNCERKPRIEIVAKIAYVLNTSLDYLLGFSDLKNFTTRKLNKNAMEIQRLLTNLNILNSNRELSDAQVETLKKIIKDNKDLMLDRKEESRA